MLREVRHVVNNLKQSCSLLTHIPAAADDTAGERSLYGPFSKPRPTSLTWGGRREICNFLCIHLFVLCTPGIWLVFSGMWYDDCGEGVCEAFLFWWVRVCNRQPWHLRSLFMWVAKCHYIIRATLVQVYCICGLNFMSTSVWTRDWCVSWLSLVQPEGSCDSPDQTKGL